MKIKTPKYKNILVMAVIVFTVILLVEVIPGYYEIGSSLISVAFQKLSGSNVDELSDKLIEIKKEEAKLKKKFYGEFSTSENNYNFSNALEKFNVNNNEFNISINSIKPIKKVKKGRLNFQRINLGLNSDFANIYNYCRWLEITGSTIDFEEIQITRQKDSDLLKTNLLIDVLYSGVNE